MKFFLDTANIDEISKATSLGIIDGVTTNPSLVSKENLNSEHTLYNHYRKICEIVDGPVSAEVIATETEQMIAEAKKLAQIDSNIVVKIPATINGIQTIKSLSELNINTNCTLIFSLQQAMMAMKAGATYISPFIGRLEDNGIDGLQTIKTIIDARNLYSFETEIISTSVRHNFHIQKCIEYGADIVTCPFNFLISLIEHPLTDKGLKKFLQDFNSIQNG